MSRSKELYALLKVFDEDMKAGNKEHIKTDLEKIAQYKDHRDYGFVSADVMWRFLSSIKHNEYKLQYSKLYMPSESELYRQKLYKVTALFNQAIKVIKVDNHNKKIAQGYVEKHHLGVSRAVLDFLNSKNEKDERYYSTRQRIQHIYDYYRYGEKFDKKEFEVKTTELFDLLTDSDVDWRYAHFSSLYTILSKRAEHKEFTPQLNLFDGNNKTKDSIDKELLKDCARIYVGSLMKKREAQELNAPAMRKFAQMMKAVVRKNSFMREEVKELSKILKTHPFRTAAAEKHLADTANMLVETYDNKEKHEIEKVLQWTQESPRKRPQEKEIQNQVAVDMLYQKLIQEQDIGHINFEQIYKNKKEEFQQNVVRRYQIKGDKKEAQTQELFETKEQIQEKFAIIKRKIDKISTKKNFHYGIISFGITNGYIKNESQNLNIRQALEQNTNRR